MTDKATQVQIRLLEGQACGQWGLDAGAEAGEEAVEPEKCAVEVDGVG